MLHDDFVTAEYAVWAAYEYVSKANGRTPAEDLRILRTACIAVLQRRYKSVDLELKPMAISLSGGSLARDVDVVPSHWHDTLLWKQTRDQRHREICVLDSEKGETLKNRPFMHIAEIRDKCESVGGALRKVIRLLKNLRYDADQKIDLSSYDIAALAWHMSHSELLVPHRVDLLLVERARDHLRYVLDTPSYRDALKVPDGSRIIFDAPGKVQAATALYREVDRLYEDMSAELLARAAVGLAPVDVMHRPIFFS